MELPKRASKTQKLHFGAGSCKMELLGGSGNPSGLGRLVRDFLEGKHKVLEGCEAGQRVIDELDRLLHEEKCPVLSVLKNYALLREK